jgi:hypothetical protein
LSSVDNYILLASVLDEIDSPPLNYVNDKLNHLTQGQFFQLNQHAGGPKHMEANIYAIATNHFPLSEMAKLVSVAPWAQPEAVSIAHKGEGDKAFKLHHLNDLRRIVSDLAST